MNGFRKTGAQASSRRSEAWKNQALCTPVLNANPSLFDRLWGFEEEVSRDFVRVGKLICAECPVRAECLAEAIVDELQDGIYGGMALTDRKYAARLIEDQGLKIRDSSWAGRADRLSMIVSWIRTHPSFYDDVAVQANRLRARKRTRSSSYRPRRAPLRRSVPRKVSSNLMSPLF